MKRIVSVAVLLLASFLVVSRAAEPAAAAPAAAGNVIVPGQKDTASGALHALQTW
ncbi:MAG: hypothetical protein HN849_30370, partial [Victivallales bacterium]|nr:hypothetical protein [Victivallales bacterium]